MSMEAIMTIEDLDGYCNTIMGTVAELRAPIRPGDTFDIAEHIPSKDQRKSFEAVVLMLEHIEYLTGLLRYDVSVSHESCPEHDGIAILAVQRVKDTIAAL